MSTQEEASGHHPRILLVVGGGIAAYKACELVRLIRKGGGDVTCVVTKGGQQFVTPMSLAALSENQVYTSLFDLKNEAEMGHIQLSREADLVVVCPATADLLAKMATGIADDLATTLILATDKPVMAVPAMNVRMWEHEATKRNIGLLKAAGVTVLHPDEGPMACGEFGYGRLPEPEAIWRAIAAHFGMEVAEPQLLEPPARRLAAPVFEVEALEPIMQLTNPWRLTLLFLVSGAATRFLADSLGRDGRDGAGAMLADGNYTFKATVTAAGATSQVPVKTLTTVRSVSQEDPASDLMVLVDGGRSVKMSSLQRISG